MVVNTPEMLLTDPQLTASGFWQFVEHPTEGRLRMCDPPIRFSQTPSTIRQLPPLLGEHSIAVLNEVGYSSDEIEAMILPGYAASRGVTSAVIDHKPGDLAFFPAWPGVTYSGPAACADSRMTALLGGTAVSTKKLARATAAAKKTKA